MAATRFPLPPRGHRKRVFSIVVLLAFALVNAIAGVEYPPLFANVAAILALVVLAWREMHAQQQPHR
jgi:hypothetical protein